MRINVFMLFISLVLSGLIFYGFYKWDGDMLVSIGSSVVSLFLLATSFAIGSKTAPRGAAMVKVVSGLLFAIMLVVNILFAKYDVSETTYIITNGIALCIWAVLFYGISSSKQ